jgi:copper homeostasis protein
MNPLPSTRNTSSTIIEVCVGSVADVWAAEHAGAHRVELCGALELGGLTPSLGLVETVLAATRLPVIVMIRPRAGGFAYDAHEFAAMLSDATRFLDLGAAGIVFGVLDREGRVDAARCRELVSLAAGAQTVFHKALDFVPDQCAAVETLCELGCTRVLTSGGRSSALAGAAVLRDLVSVAADRITVMPGGGLNATNVGEVIAVTRCREIHIGAAVPRDDGSIAPDIGLELVDRRFLQGVGYRAVDYSAVAAVVAIAATRRGV